MTQSQNSMHLARHDLYFMWWKWGSFKHKWRSKLLFHLIDNERNTQQPKFREMATCNVFHAIFDVPFSSSSSMFFQYILRQLLWFNVGEGHRLFPLTFINDDPSISVVLLCGSELTTCPCNCTHHMWTCEFHAFFPDIWLLLTFGLGSAWKLFKSHSERSACHY